MTRAAGVAAGIASAVEMPKPRPPGLGQRLQDSGAMASVFSEQLDALAAAVVFSETGTNSATAEERETAEAGQKRQHPSDAVDVVEPKGRLIPAAREIQFPLDEAGADQGHTGTRHQRAVDDTAKVQGEPKLLEMANVVRSSIDKTTASRQGPPERTARASNETAAPRPVSDRRDLPDARQTLQGVANPNRDAAGRANIGPSGVYQPAPAIIAPARLSPTNTPATRAATKAAVDRQSSLRAGDVSVRVVRHETHLPPAERLSPAAQIANVVATSLQRADELQPVRSAAGAPPEPPTVARVVRVLQIRLEPPELGTVTVRMRLDANTLKVRIDARQPGTADLLRSDQGALTRLLQLAGYDVETLTVHALESDRGTVSSAPSAHQSSQNAPHQSAFQAHSGNAQPDGKSGEAHQHAKRENEAAGAAAAEPGSEPPGAVVPGSGGIYV